MVRGTITAAFLCIKGNSCRVISTAHLTEKLQCVISNGTHAVYKLRRHIKDALFAFLQSQTRGLMELSVAVDESMVIYIYFYIYIYFKSSINLIEHLHCKNSQHS